MQACLKIMYCIAILHFARLKCLIAATEEKPTGTYMANNYTQNALTTIYWTTNATFFTQSNISSSTTVFNTLESIVEALFATTDVSENFTLLITKSSPSDSGKPLTLEYEYFSEITESSSNDSMSDKSELTLVYGTVSENLTFSFEITESLSSNSTSAEFETPSSPGSTAVGGTENITFSFQITGSSLNDLRELQQISMSNVSDAPPTSTSTDGVPTENATLSFEINWTNSTDAGTTEYSSSDSREPQTLMSDQPASSSAGTTNVGVTENSTPSIHINELSTRDSMELNTADYFESSSADTTDVGTTEITNTFFKITESSSSDTTPNESEPSCSESTDAGTTELPSSDSREPQTSMSYQSASSSAGVTNWEVTENSTPSIHINELSTRDSMELNTADYFESSSEDTTDVGTTEITNTFFKITESSSSDTTPNESEPSCSESTDAGTTELPSSDSREPQTSMSYQSVSSSAGVTNWEVTENSTPSIHINELSTRDSRELNTADNFESSSADTTDVGTTEITNTFFKITESSSSDTTPNESEPSCSESTDAGTTELPSSDSREPQTSMSYQSASSSAGVTNWEVTENSTPSIHINELSTRDSMELNTADYFESSSEDTTDVGTTEITNTFFKITESSSSDTTPNESEPSCSESTDAGTTELPSSDSREPQTSMSYQSVSSSAGVTNWEVTENSTPSIHINELSTRDSRELNTADNFESSSADTTDVGTTEITSTSFKITELSASNTTPNESEPSASNSTEAGTTELSSSDSKEPQTSMSDQSTSSSAGVTNWEVTENSTPSIHINELSTRDSRELNTADNFESSSADTTDVGTTEITSTSFKITELSASNTTPNESEPSASNSTEAGTTELSSSDSKEPQTSMSDQSTSSSAGTTNWEVTENSTPSIHINQLSTRDSRELNTADNFKSSSADTTDVTAPGKATYPFKEWSESSPTGLSADETESPSAITENSTFSLEKTDPSSTETISDKSQTASPDVDMAKFSPSESQTSFSDDFDFAKTESSLNNLNGSSPKDQVSNESESTSPGIDELSQSDSGQSPTSSVSDEFKSPSADTTYVAITQTSTPAWKMTESSGLDSTANEPEPASFVTNHAEITTLSSNGTREPISSDEFETPSIWTTDVGFTENSTSSLNSTKSSTRDPAAEPQTSMFEESESPLVSTTVTTSFKITESPQNDTSYNISGSPSTDVGVMETSSLKIIEPAENEIKTSVTKNGATTELCSTTQATIYTSSLDPTVSVVTTAASTTPVSALTYTELSSKTTAFATGSNDSTEMSITNSSVLSDCRSGINYLPYPGDCQRFIHCSNGLKYVLQCPRPLYWSNAKKSCVWSQKDCSSKITPYAPVTAKPGTTCLNGADYLPYPANCKKYIQCVHAMEIIRECPPRLYWNALKKHCGWSTDFCISTI